MRHASALVLLVAMPAALAPGEVHAQSGRGFYLSQELGANFTPALDIAGDVPNAPGSICAEHLNPFTDLMPAFCSDPNAPGTSWTNTFDGAGGDGTGLDRVRSHVPSERPDGRDPGFTVITTGDLVVYGFGLNLKYQF